MMSRCFNTLLIPVESQVRELDGKVLLACTAAQRGFTVIIGSRAHIHYYASKVDNAIYMAKSMRRFSERMFKILHGLGHRIVAWDEEALVRLPDEQYYTHRLSPATFQYIDHLFSWGKSDADVFENYPYYQQQPIHQVGNPRIDILRPELRQYFTPEKNSLIAEYGDYVLINTNFGQVNHFIPGVGNQEASRDKNFNQTNNDEYITRRYKHKKILFDAFKKLVPLLASQFPQTRFILRPHPSESLLSWQQLLSQFTNVSVINSGNVIPWIMGAKALVSNGCTTSIEATVIGTPTLGYYPVRDSIIDDELPASLCDIAETAEQLAGKLKKINNGSYNIHNISKTVLDTHITSLDGALSCEKIIDVIDEYYTKPGHTHRETWRKIPSVLHNNARTVIKRIKSKNASTRQSNKYHQHRFPSISSEQLNNKIDRFATINPSFHNLRMESLDYDIFTLIPK